MTITIKETMHQVKLQDGGQVHSRIGGIGRTGRTHAKTTLKNYSFWSIGN
jgi:hypothetical protein